MKLKLEFVARDIAGETLLVPVGKTNYTFNGMITLNEMGAEIWKRLPQAETEEEIVQGILEEYDVTHEQAQKDVADFLNHLHELGIL